MIIYPQVFIPGIGTQPFGDINVETVAVKDPDQALLIRIIGNIGMMPCLGGQDQYRAFGVLVLVGKTAQTQVLMFVNNGIGS